MASMRASHRKSLSLWLLVWLFLILLSRPYGL
jgi:hypothetical protein